MNFQNPNADLTKEGTVKKIHHGNSHTKAINIKMGRYKRAKQKLHLFQ